MPTHLKTQITRELDRLELLLDQIKLTEAERDALLAAQQTTSPAPAGRMLLDFKGIGAEFAVVLWLEGLFRQFDNRRQLAAYAGCGRFERRPYVSLNRFWKRIRSRNLAQIMDREAARVRA